MTDVTLKYCDVIRFKVDTSSDAHIALLRKAHDYTDGHMYEIVLGGWGNTGSVIR